MKSIHPRALRELALEVQRETGMSLAQLRSRARGQDEALIRFLALTLAREHTLLSCRRIGAYFRRDHASVVHAVARVHDLFRLTDRWSRQWAAVYVRLSANVQRRLELAEGRA